MTAATAAPTPLPRSVWLASAGWILSATADNFLLFTILWSAGLQGWSGVEIALVLVALRLPTLAGGVLGGRAVDSLGGRPLIVASVASRAGLMAALAVAGWSGTLPMPAVLATGAIAGGLMPLSHAGARWLVPRLVPERNLARANAALSLGDQLPLLAGAALVGPALALLGPGRGLLVAAAMLALAAVLAARLPGGERLGAGPLGSPAETDCRSGGASRRASGVVALVALSVAYYFAYGPFETVSPAFVRQDLGGDAGTYALLWSLFGAGALATLRLAPVLGSRRPGLANALGAVVWGLVMLPLALAGGVLPAAAIFLAGGAIWGPYSTIEATALQLWSDPARHGRTFGVQRALLSTAAPLGAAAGAIALDHLAPGVILAASSAACAAAGALALCAPSVHRPAAPRARSVGRAAGVRWSPRRPGPSPRAATRRPAPRPSTSG
jgi:predicted MFS family arabinose efflux permease